MKPFSHYAPHDAETALSLINSQAIRIAVLEVLLQTQQELECEKEELSDRCKVLTTENDELLNDLHASFGDIEDLEQQVEGLNTSNAQIRARTKHVQTRLENAEEDLEENIITQSKAVAALERQGKNILRVQQEMCFALHQVHSVESWSNVVSKAQGQLSNAKNLLSSLASCADNSTVDSVSISMLEENRRSSMPALRHSPKKQDTQTHRNENKSWGSILGDGKVSPTEHVGVSTVPFAPSFMSNVAQGVTHYFCESVTISNNTQARRQRAHSDAAIYEAALQTKPTRAFGSMGSGTARVSTGSKDEHGVRATMSKKLSSDLLVGFQSTSNRVLCRSGKHDTPSKVRHTAKETKKDAVREAQLAYVGRAA
jgi:hypothetical protein